MVKKPLYVLLVENDETYIEIIQSAFKKYTLEVSLIVTHSIGEARSVIEKFVPDLVVTDFSLPDGKGHELLKEGDKESTYPIIIMTSRENIKTAVNVVKARVFDCIIKSEATLNNLPKICENANSEWNQINELKMVKDELQQRVRELSALNKLMQKVNSNLSLEQVVQVALKGIIPLVEPDLVMIFLRQGDDLSLQGLHRSDPKYNHHEEGLHRVGECLCGISAKEGKAVYSYDIHSDHRCTWNGCKMAGLRSFAAFPLLKDGNVIGVLGLASGEKNRDFEKQSNFLEILANGIAIGLQNAILYKEANENREELIKTNETLKTEIVERAKAEKELKKTNRLLEGTFLGIKELVMVVDMSTRSIISCNKAVEDIFGYKIDEVLGRNVDFLHINHEMYKKFGYMLYSALDKYGSFQTRYKMKRKDGSIIFTEHTVNEIKADSGLRYAVVSVIRDITENKRAEDDMRYLRNLLKNVIDSMPSVLVTVDYNGKIMQWNREAETYTGVSMEDASGRRLTEVFSHPPIDIKEVQEVIRSRTPRKDEKLPGNIDGERRLSDVTIYPLIANGVKGAVIRIDDVTERARIEEMMIQSEKMLSVGGLAAGMAHEINNPLAGILQSSQVVLDRTLSDLPANQKAAQDCGIEFDTIKAYMIKREVINMIEAIRSSGQRAAKIVSNMLNFSRKSDSDFKSHNLAELLDQTLELACNDYDLMKKFDFRQIEIERQYETSLPAVNCEETKIEQVILNLLKNGAQAMAGKRYEEQKPKFIIRTLKNGNMAQIEVEDNGPGMNGMTSKRVFEPFFSTKDVGIGTGLGLSVSYFIITENHGGTMSVESEPDKGTKFIIRLPIEKRV